MMKKNIDIDELLFIKVTALAKAEETTINAILKRAVQCYLAQTPKNKLMHIEDDFDDLLLVQDVDTSSIVNEKAILDLLTKAQAKN